MTTHALYRFFAADGALLYIGLTCNPGTRWKQHSHDKPWWHEVATITSEVFPNQQAVSVAERAAIIDEKPRYNIQHNGGGARPAIVPITRVAPLQVGDWVALGLRDGRCPVGMIQGLNDQWVSVRHKSFITGMLTQHVSAERWDNVERAELAYPEDALPADELTTAMGCKMEMQDEHLGNFQTGWTRSRQPDGDPVWKAYCAAEQDLRQPLHDA